MATRTFYLDEFDLDVDITKVTARELKKQIAERVGLPPVKDLFRLEGFQEPWELMCVSFSSCSSSFKYIYFFLSISTRFSCAFSLELTNPLLAFPKRKYEKSQYKGVELQADKPLCESGVPEKDDSNMSGENGVPIIVAVRKHLVAEGWKMVHNDAMDSDTEEDDF